ncbi:hypothetical protein CU098_007181 [Rhizopus stolonifer]|uniref:Uncharacterized protein n=1 Tax=Rhizopus stolonifer TaxID=4846 RepID=A0A367JEV4_RHIST|nr:hypothetical protein CU098_007181 [Rhizopus stolonifer]
MTDKSKLEANEKIQTQIDASIGIARSLIQSWLPPPQLGEKLEEDQDDLDTMDKYATGRPDRLGLGAKFLSHKDAMRHNQDGSLPSKQEIQLKNKILNQNKRAEPPVNNKKKKIGQQGDFLSMYLSERQQKKKSKK